MRINFYDTRLSEDDRTMLVKEKGINYDAKDIKSPEQTVQMMKDILHMDELAEEQCYMIGLNSACKVTGLFFISKGTVNTSLISARELFIRALLIGAVMIIICHNHPSQSAEPSETDMETTDRIKEAGELIGIPLIDHIIICKNEYYSFSESGLLGIKGDRHMESGRCTPKIKTV